MAVIAESLPRRLAGPPGPAGGAERFRWGRLALGGILFVAITAGIFWYQFSRIETGDRIPTRDQLRYGYLFAVLALLPAETLLSGFRMWMICRVLQPGVSYATCVRAELANAGIAILTPSQTGGGPGQIYLLNRGGVALGTALSVSVLSFAGTMAALAGMGMATLLAAGGNGIPSFFTGAALALSLVAALIVLSALWPGLFRAAISGWSRFYRRMTGRRGAPENCRPPGAAPADPPLDRMGRVATRLVETLHAYADDVGRFLRKGKVVFLLVCVITIIFFMCRFIIAFLCVRFLGIGDCSLAQVVRNQMALLFVTYLGPTPGSAGIAEGASKAIMAGIVPPGYAPYYNLLWRFSTIYFAAATGLIIVLSTACRDMSGTLRRRRGEGP